MNAPAEGVSRNYPQHHNYGLPDPHLLEPPPYYTTSRVSKDSWLCRSIFTLRKHQWPCAQDPDVLQRLVLSAHRHHPHSSYHLPRKCPDTAAARRMGQNDLGRMRIRIQGCFSQLNLDDAHSGTGSSLRILKSDHDTGNGLDGVVFDQSACL